VHVHIAARDAILGAARHELPAYLLRQRWYPAKDAGLPTVRLCTWIPFDLPGLPAGIAVWEAQSPGRPPFRLLLPLALVPEAQLPADHVAVLGPVPQSAALLADAFVSDDFVRAFVRLMWADGNASPASGALRGRHTERAQVDSVEGPIRRGTAEQSNTSMRIGDRLILKVLRRLEWGVHPELEMGRFLTEEAHFKATPALIGWIDLDGSTLAILMAFVPNDGDGWSWVLERLRAGERERALTWIRRLGEVTAELHLALAISTGDPAFEPAPVTDADWEQWSGAALGMAADVRESLRANRAALDGVTRALADGFERSADTLSQQLRLHPLRSVVAKTRHHGDYHLGQILVQGEDAVIVDFEGEPLRPLSARRAKHLPLRDVAGMLRSLGYAAAVVGREGRVDEALLEAWLAEASQAYVDSYLATAAAGPGCPAERADALRLIRFFTLDKALYEMRYELANRPGWVGIPLAAVQRLIDREPPLQRVHRMPHGADVLPAGGVRFRLWAPRYASIRLALEHDAREEGTRELAMTALEAGWHELLVPDAGAGTRYRYVLPDGMRVPDPASRFQPDDVHGPSEVIDPVAHAWQDDGWAGRPWHEAVIYEIHVGAFTEQGTFRAAIARLDHLAALGVTAIELMPIGDFPGQRNWGYDGVLPYAPDSSYGRPEDLKALIEAAHARGIMVLLDVVYNHFGPDGNYLPVYAPNFFTERHHTPWGAALDFDGADSAPVREFIIHNALYWIEEYNLDGLRLDAVHAILDDSPKDILDELAERVRSRRRHVHLILENEENQAARLVRYPSGSPRFYSAQWNDDLHHVLHTAATGEDSGYYREYRGDTEKLARALAEGFVFQGEMMDYRGSVRGEPSASLPPTAFVAFIQNHDQIGNRAFGERITALAGVAAVQAIAAVYLLLPQVPLLFMGEEWGAAEAFAFFCDFDGELGEAVRTGRREEFAKFPEFRDPAKRARIPDPQAEATFTSAKLDWNALAREPHAAWLAFYRAVLEVRRTVVVPLLPHLRGHAGQAEVVGPLAVRVRWQTERTEVLVVSANLSAEPVPGFAPPARGARVLLEQGQLDSAGTAPPWWVRWTLE